uniref:hypothetical protein n=1 Tax=Proteus sp. G4465 TaxID=2698868 RepID=UPI001F3DD332
FGYINKLREILTMMPLKFNEINLFSVLKRLRESRVRVSVCRDIALIYFSEKNLLLENFYLNLNFFIMMISVLVI